MKTGGKPGTGGRSLEAPSSELAEDARSLRGAEKTIANLEIFPCYKVLRIIQTPRVH